MDAIKNRAGLIAAGMDPDDLLKRLMGNAKLVELFVGKFLADKNYAALVSAMETGDTKAAESASHTLKGMCGNLSLTKLYQLFTRQVQCIRAGEWEDAVAMMPEITASYENTTAQLQLWLTA